jgi:hypothetical protein
LEQEIEDFSSSDESSPPRTLNFSQKPIQKLSLTQQHTKSTPSKGSKSKSTLHIDYNKIIEEEIEECDDVIEIEQPEENKPKEKKKSVRKSKSSKT